MGRNRLRVASMAASVDGHAAVVQVTGEFHDQDGVLACQGDHEDEADLSIEIAVVSADQQSEEDPDKGHGHDENNRAR